MTPKNYSTYEIDRLIQKVTELWQASQKPYHDQSEHNHIDRDIFDKNRTAIWTNSGNRRVLTEFLEKLKNEC